MQVEASETGVWWRDLRGWHDADWDDLTDFYADNKANFWLTTRDGRKVTFERSWQNRELLQKAIIGHIGEQLGLREWAFKGTRNIDLPRTFAYDARAIQCSYGWNSFPIALIAGLFSTALLIPAKPGEALAIENPFLLTFAALGIGSMLGMGLYVGRDIRVPKERL